jgi:hypothetical protein
MLDRQSREVRICGEIACGLTANEQVFEERPVTLCWSNNSHVGPIQPALDPVNRLFHAQGSLEHPSIGGDADESEDHRPAETDHIVSADLFIPPLASSLMGWTSGVFSVQQQVRVNEDYRASSPSSCDRSS